MTKRRRAREYALQMLFQMEFTPDQTPGQPSDQSSGQSAFWADKKEEPEVMEFANALAVGAHQNIERIDEEIRVAAENWSTERMAAVDRNILRAAVYELLFVPDVPPAVAINEALEIAKKFSTLESASFINGILDRIARKAERIS
jgi:N utilization substance protein B